MNLFGRVDREHPSLTGFIYGAGYSGECDAPCHHGISEVAEVTAEMPLTRRERLARWAELLDQDPRRQLATFAGTEYEAGENRALIRRPNSPFSLAFADPLLRATGLKDDTYGEAKRFFQLSDHQLHNIVCSCHYGSAVSAGQAARHVRAAIRKSMVFEGGKSIWKWLVGRSSR